MLRRLMGTAAEGLRSEVLTGAFEEAIKGRPERLYVQLCIQSGLPGTRMNIVLAQLTGRRKPRPVLRAAITGWLGYMDAVVLDWTESKDIPREKLRDLLLAAFAATLAAAQQVDPKVRVVPPPCGASGDK